MSVQVTLNITDDLYRRAERIARARQRDVTELLAESINLPQIVEDSTLTDEDSAIEREKAAYHAMHHDLLEKYQGQYIALHHGELVTHGPDFETVFTQVNQKYLHEFVLIRRVEVESDPVYRFRSPRLVRES